MTEANKRLFRENMTYFIEDHNELSHKLHLFLTVRFEELIKEGYYFADIITTMHSEVSSIGTSFKLTNMIENFNEDNDTNNVREPYGQLRLRNFIDM